MSENMFVCMVIYMFVSAIVMMIAGSIFSEKDEDKDFIEFLFSWSLVVWAGTFWILILIGAVLFIICMSCKYPVKDFVKAIKGKIEFDKKKKGVSV